jgi:hypothetical protein
VQQGQFSLLAHYTDKRVTYKYYKMLSSVGSLVVQYAKNVVGASKVVAIAGPNSDWLKAVGADVVLFVFVFKNPRVILC